jgi:acetyl-CoA C-acetyltransferase
MRDVVILSGVRTAIGDYGGALKSVAPADLAAKVVQEAVIRAKIDPNEIGHLVFGNVIPGEPRDMYLARVAGINGGLPQHTTAMTVNRLCGSGLQAIISASQAILLNETDAAVAGGAESMSRGGYLLPALRWGQRMNDGITADMMVGALTDPFDHVHMGITAENIAAQWQIDREAQDKFAVESHRRALHAIKNGYFKEQILPIEIITNKETIIVDTDEHPRPNTSLENLTKLQPVFKKNGTVTAGNASGINDSAAALVLMDSRMAEKHNLKPLARLVSYGHAGVDPKFMGMGPIPAVQIALQRANL